MRIWSHDRATSCLGMRSSFYRRRFPVFGVRATDFGSWIDFNFSATNRTEPIRLLLFYNNCLIRMLKPLVAQSCDWLSPLLSIDHTGRATTFTQVETRLKAL